MGLTEKNNSKINNKDSNIFRIFVCISLIYL